MTDTILANCAGYCEACNGDDRYPHRDSLAVRMQRSVPATTKEPAVSATTDAVNSPKHYASGSVECIEAIKASMSSEAFCGYLKGNVQKYLWRYEKKVAPLEDLHKAQVYLRWLIEENQP
ncbi:hypothetical protein KMI6_41 [Klebsiella phage KMI6]|uniref:DUF3310 domain-containing protein n=2 Tax=Drulisvirus TaxID=1920774 RepID=A0A5B9NEV7_9CAUD|nr:hypothetical protein KMI3_24 [Klebsiella phage KMI3]QEG10093.1 hypothetical protein KMI5_34 [Klebsiella phage KMI5]QEG10150.1 hypothetical protein KMI6_41 [Klebsiella phage KMI6]